ncbi:MAG: YidC/Oxa1 family membrane protein insertase [Oscillospiraceae bacterium]|jgi:YidC/Oxa1 family membrane protein insertase|nr:YidC/Oxa1 family membrane protein insertase [Oscillospiraceae bacterium]
MWGVYELVKNYGVAIILFTLITKILLFPVGLQTHRAMLRNRVLAPKLQALKKKYPNNPQKVQEEQLKLQQEEGVSMTGGCLPSIVQILLLFGVIDVIYRPLTHILRVSRDAIAAAKEIVMSIDETLLSKASMREELVILNEVKKNPEIFSSIEGLSDKVAGLNYTIFGNVDLGSIPTFKPEVWNGAAIILFLIPILSGLSQLGMTIYMQYTQKKNNPEMPTMPGMNAMLYGMPIFSVWLAFQVPAGVGIYWIATAVFGLIQSLILNMYYNKERADAYIGAQREKSKSKPKKPGLMQRMLEQQQALQNQQNGGKRDDGAVEYETDEDGLHPLTKKEVNKYNSSKIKEARRRMAEKYGDSYDDESESE